ncbi:TRAP transporter small permease [Tropicibacter oceani]|uniref:TRAP transporter small permease protein n=1 Tax=Tropicibacter oceani TaxID=3058420 RepID=A0ABY8QJW9_9RHOB|nr:TRAP transporter small permease subunit [Tropicibacter oceani]WGW04925.1 TRAP transporter small permease subunit [Tropicibacter oceani]
MTRSEKLIRGLTFAARLGTGLSFAVLIAAVLIQVVGRFVGNSPVWTEELTRFALLFTVAFGAGLSFRTGDLVNVDVICESLPGRAPLMLRLLAAVVTAGLALYLLPHAWKYVSIGKMQTSPALGLRMDGVHFTVYLMLALLAVFGLLRVIGILTGAEDGKPVKSEED